MFSVICVNSGAPGKTRDSFGNVGAYCPPVYVGNSYTVIKEGCFHNTPCYELAEIPPVRRTHYWYNTNMFATTGSDIEEEVLVNTREEFA